jgi:ADP-heptose:LPS heptosyltransferase
MRLLFIRFSSIGDIVLTTPAIRCAKQQIPGVEIHFLTKRSMEDLVAANPYIDQCHYLESDVDATIDALKKIKFDYIIDLHHNLRTWKIKSALGVKAFCYHKLSLKKLLLAKLHINLLPTTHVCERYIDSLKYFNVVNDGKGLDYFFPSKTSFSAANLPTSHQAGFVAFVIGASYFNKKMPIDKWIQLAAKIKMPIVLIGGKEDEMAATSIATSNSIGIYNACGKYSIQESASILQMSKLVVSHDTGFLHIAAAFKKPTITIWGATSPALQFEAYYPRENAPAHYNALVPNLNCQPCSKQGAGKCPQGHFACMQLQDIDLVASKVLAFL